MLKYFFNILLVLITLGSFAQEMPVRPKYFRVGMDLSRFALGFVNDIGIKGYELSFDTEIKYNFFPTFEIGTNTIDDKTDAHHYKAEGNYWRIGFDYNLLKYQHRLDKNIFYVGIRIGHCGFSQEAPIITFENAWGIYETAVAKTNLKANWAEAVMGLRGEIYKGIFLGYSVRLKGLITQTNDGGITPFFIPGYGKGEKKIHAGMNYSIYYAIPIKKIKFSSKKESVE